MTEDFFKLFLATLYGGIIGIERQFWGQHAGFRTQILVCLGACLFSIISINSINNLGSSVDPTRIAAHIVVGIGFLGAGAILRYGVTIRGLTTAASLWMVSAIGMAIGFGEYGIALVSTIIVFVNLTILRKLEDLLPVNKYCTLIIRLKGSEGLEIKELAKPFNINVLTLKQKYLKEDNIFEQETSIRYKDNKQIKDFFRLLKEIPSVIELSIS